MHAPIGQNPVKPSVITLADRARDQGKWERAAEHYRKALHRNPRNSPIWVQYGHVLKQTGNLAAAEKAYRKALAYDPRAVDSHVQLGHVLKLQGKEAEARAAYLGAFALDPSLDAASAEFAQLGWSEAHVSELRHMLGGSVPEPSALADVNGTSPEHSPIPVALGISEIRPQENLTTDRNARPSRTGFTTPPSSAKKPNLRLSTKRKGPSPITLADRARDSAQWEVATRRYREALDRNPRNSPIWIQLGHVLKESGKLAEAENAYRKAIQYDRHSADAYLQLGHALKLQERREEAATAYLGALLLNPSMENPALELARFGWSPQIIHELKQADALRSYLLILGDKFRLGSAAEGADGIYKRPTISGLYRVCRDKLGILSKTSTVSDGTDIGSPDPAFEPIGRSGLFDQQWYLLRNPDVKAAGIDPLHHFVTVGWKQGRDPHPLFDTDWYLKEQSDVKADGLNPLSHFLSSGATEGRNPNPYFDTKWYCKNNPEIAEANINPLVHYMEIGATAGRDPHPRFNTSQYLTNYPEVRAAGINPLAHYLIWGAAHGCRSDASHPSTNMSSQYAAVDEISASALSKMREDNLNWINRHFQYQPLNVFVDPRLATRPSLSILLPGVNKRHATGGPNTAYVLGCLLAREEIPVNFVSMDIAPDQDLGPLKQHLLQLTGINVDEYDVEFLDASDRHKPLSVGYNDILFATAWWTAQPAKSVAKLLRKSRFYYLIQDYECLFYGSSVLHAVAEQTYEFDHLPVINTRLLRDHLVQDRAGRYADPQFAETAIVFEPAVDRSHFYPEARKAGSSRRLLFYTRPTVAERNLFGLGLMALRAAVEAGLFGDVGWEFIGMGEFQSFDPIPLGRGYSLTAAPWLDFDGYAAQMRSADILLSLMFSPHPSYPPLEMAACGGIAVTTVFGSKTADRLRELSPNIIGVTPSLEDLVRGLTRGLILRDAQQPGEVPTIPPLPLPGSWIESLSAVLPRLVAELKADGITSENSDLAEPITFIRTDLVMEQRPGHYPGLYARRLLARKRLYRPASTENVISIVTPVHDTDARYLTDLAHSVLGQDTDLAFEWLILDNGSKNLETIDALQRIGRDARVHVTHVPENLGIIGGTRWCLEHASGRYIVPVDHDDLLFPDCIRTVQSFIEQAGSPPLIYTDEDKTDGTFHREAYSKPEWDPVLFVHSCYIAHLTAIDRRLALELDCYTDGRVEGCPDWDTFMRFMLAGYQPLHLPEVLYSWRLHHGSSSLNLASKPYLSASHHALLERFLHLRGGFGKYHVSTSPLYRGTPDYRFRPATPRAQIPAIVLDVRVAREALAHELARLPQDADLIHLVDPSCEITSELSLEEARTLMDLFPDTAMLGGRVHDGNQIREAGYVFGYGGVIGCPDRGRVLGDSGYFNLMWKPRSVAAVSARHCVVTREFLHQSLHSLPADISLALLGPWLGAQARKNGSRVIYSPFCEAKVPLKTNTALTNADLAVFSARFGDLANDQVGYVKRFDLSGERPFQPDEEAKRPPPLLSYESYLAQRILDRKPNVSTSTKPTPTISLLTTVYQRTDATLFRETAAAVTAQTQLPTEWVVLAHGPIQDDLAATLDALDAKGDIRLLKHDVNLGIHGGLRYCLERATGDFVLSLDADDLLTPDALALLTEAAMDNPERKIFYSDEDHLISGVPMHPFYRPDFDPVHLRAHSYIWHAILFDRELALSLGVYTSAETEYAQDWDTLLRFDFAGCQPFHVREVLYHWRQHAQSLSNSGKIFEGSLRSIRSALEMIRRTSPCADNYEVAPYPCDVGMPDFYLKRLSRNAPSTLLVSFQWPSGEEAPGRGSFPFRDRTVVPAQRGPAGLAALAGALRSSTSEVAVLLGPGIAILDDGGLWQAVKHLELLSKVMAVGGPLAKITGQVVFGGPVWLDPTAIIDPIAGRSILDRGQFQFSLMKPHCVGALSVDLMVGRREFFLEALETRPAELALRSFGWWLGSHAERHGGLLAYEPLLRAFIQDESWLLGDAAEGLQTSAKTLAASPEAAAHIPLRGLSGFEQHRYLHPM
jgi:tetratricopeptide (TPR) repeat protein/glycosyltransferase involved in cell wall biosynthesis